MNKDEGAYKLNRIFDQLIKKTATQFQQGWRHQQAIKQLVDQMSLPVWVNKISDRDWNYLKWVLFHIGSVSETVSNYA